MAAVTAASALAGVGSGVSFLGTIAGANAQRANGAAQQQQLNYKAGQEDQAAGQARAASQREMFDTQKKTLQAQSTLVARASADGGTATDPTALTLSEDIAGRGEYNALADMFRGEDKARGLEQQATADRYSGIVARKGGNMAATGTILSGIGSMASRFGGSDSTRTGLFG